MRALQAVTKYVVEVEVEPGDGAGGGEGGGEGGGDPCGGRQLRIVSRNAFVAPPGRLLVSADYSQVHGGGRGRHVLATAADSTMVGNWAEAQTDSQPGARILVPGGTCTSATVADACCRILAVPTNFASARFPHPTLVCCVPNSRSHRSSCGCWRT